jgi:hypothetical protein
MNGERLGLKWRALSAVTYDNEICADLPGEFFDFFRRLAAHQLM